jgi:4-aminobutyrate aminotransferase-like enzyme
MPIGAFIASEEVARAFDPSDHFSTFGGNPLSCKVASATIDLLTKNKIPENAEKIGNYIMEGLRELMSRFEIVGDVRGKGLLIGVELVKDKGSRAPAPQEAKKLVDEIRKKGVLMAATGIYGCTIRLSPPLIITEEDASKFLSLFKDSLKEVSG